MLIQKQLVILHLSDLHFGKHGRFQTSDIPDVADRFCASVTDELSQREIETPVAMMVVTGDITETGVEQEYADATLFFESVATKLSLDRRRFVFIPGNHDVSWIECQRAELDLKEHNLPDSELRRQMDNRKFQPFERFVEKFLGEKRSSLGKLLPKGGYVFDFPELHLSVATLNTCEIESHRENDHLGVLSTEQAQSLMNHWKDPAEGSAVRIIAVHHNPIATIPTSVKDWLSFLKTQHDSKAISQETLERFANDVVGFEGRDLLDRVAEDTNTSLVLHGHHHVNGFTSIPWQRGVKGQTHLISAGSWGLIPNKLPQMQTNSAQIVQLDIENRELIVSGLLYDPSQRLKGKVTLGSFVQDKNNPEGYRQALWIPELTGSDARDPAPNNGVSDFPKPPRRWQLPPSRHALTHTFDVAGHTGSLTIGLYGNGRPGEVFITMAKAGSTVSGLTETISILLSQLLQCGYPLHEIIAKLEHMRFEPSGFTKNPDIPIAKSIVDYIARYLATIFPEEETDEHRFSPSQGSLCRTCGNLMSITGETQQCYNCGKH